MCGVMQDSDVPGGGPGSAAPRLESLQLALWVLGSALREWDMETVLAMFLPW